MSAAKSPKIHTIADLEDGLRKGCNFACTGCFCPVPVAMSPAEAPECPACGGDSFRSIHDILPVLERAGRLEAAHRSGKAWTCISCEFSLENPINAEGRVVCPECGQGPFHSTEDLRRRILEGIRRERAAA